MCSEPHRQTGWTATSGGAADASSAAAAPATNPSPTAPPPASGSPPPAHGCSSEGRSSPDVPACAATSEAGRGASRSQTASRAPARSSPCGGWISAGSAAGPTADDADEVPAATSERAECGAADQSRGHSSGRCGCGGGDDGLGPCGGAGREDAVSERERGHRGEAADEVSESKDCRVDSTVRPACKVCVLSNES